MVERCKQPGLALEACQTLGIRREVVGEDLDRHLAIEGGIECLPDDTHPPLADLLD